MILVTGATGFLGAELVKQLLQTHQQIRCTKRGSSAIPKKLLAFADKIEWVNANVLDFSDLEQAFEGITQVYHCAAMVSFYKKDVKAMMEINVQGTANVVNLALANSIQKLVHVSSVAALGFAKANEEVTELNFWDAYDKNGNYAISKYRSEMEVWRGINEGLNAVIVNPSVIIGAGIGSEGSGKMFDLAKKTNGYYTKGSNGFVDVQDVAKAMIGLMESDITEERFIINAENYDFQQLFTEISEAFGLPAPKKEVKKWQAALLFQASKWMSPFIAKVPRVSKELLDAAFKHTKYNNSKIKNALSIVFKPVAQSITETVNSIKSV